MDNSLQSATVMRFGTLCGATIVVTQRPGKPISNYSWRCLGCLAKGDLLREVTVRQEANTHAGMCRSMPQPDPATVEHNLNT